jgi:acetyl esterase/lipase
MTRRPLKTGRVMSHTEECSSNPLIESGAGSKLPAVNPEGLSRTRLRRAWTLLGVPAAAFALFALADSPPVEQDGAIHVSAFDLPLSSLLDDNARKQLVSALQGENDGAATPCPPLEGVSAAQAPVIRACEEQRFRASSDYRHLRERYPITVTTRRFGGVETEVFTPAEGVSARNRDRVLIDLHGGGFQGGWHSISDLESMPVAAIGNFTVVSVNYRLAPEFTFPAASEDVAAVYRELLKSYRPQNIGIYGCSAGGMLTAQVVAWLQKRRLPLPGAVGMLCDGAVYWKEGDSGYWGLALNGESPASYRENPYLRTADPSDPLAFPGRSPTVLAKFPPSLLISATRDQGLSSVVYTHSALVAQGVFAELHVWEGLGHAFFYDPDLPQTAEVNTVIVRFFDKRLGTRAKVHGQH